MSQTLLSQGAEAKILLDKSKNQIIKDRIPKSYRIKELDDKLRTRRTRSEAKLLIKASQIINVPIPQEPKDNKIIMPFIQGKKLSEHLDSFQLAKQKQILKQIGKDIAKLHDADIIHGDLTTSNMILVDDCTSNEVDRLKDINNKNITDNQTAKNLKSIINKLKGGGERSELLGRDYLRTNIKLNNEQIMEIKNKRASANQSFKIFFIDFGLGFFNGKFEDKAVDIHLLKQALEAKHFKNWQETYQSFLEGYKNSKNYEKTIAQLSKVESRGRYKDKY